MTLSLAAIAERLQGYDPQALAATDVNHFLAEMVSPVTDIDTVGIFDALGRVLAQDIVSPFSVPPHDNSAMDGYAFHGAVLQAGAALTLTPVGTALAGVAWRGSVAPGQCVKIMTGAVMPDGLDTVVPQEFVTRHDDGRITIPADLLRLGDNRRLAGEDLQQGSVALPAGERLGPAALGLLASLGLATVPVWRRLRVAYFSTGNEILSLGEAPREGAVYDSNRYTVFGLLQRLGIEVIDMGVVRDEPALLEAAFLEAARRADAIITSGGVSVGEADHTRTMMKQLGDVEFWRIAMRPGRPMAVGRIHTPAPDLQAKNASSPGNTAASSYQNKSTPNAGAVLFGLPGNPVAVMVTFLAFVRPALLRMMGCSGRSLQPPPLLRARSTQAIRKKAGRTEYQRGWVQRDASGALVVEAAANQGSGVLSSMVQANGLIVLHHGQASVAAGEEVDVMVFEGVV
jgi:molybdopterin molybdotransferase